MSKGSLKLLRDLGFEPLSGSFRRASKGGSCRSFTFFRDARKGEGVLCVFDGGRAENFFYSKIAKFLKRAGVDVFDVWHSDAKRGILVIERLGRRDLLSYKDEPEAIEKYAFSALENVLKIHTSATGLYKKKPFKIMEGFDENLYLWEQNYLWENCAKNRFCLRESLKPEADFRLLRNLLLKDGRVLIHRDFQSQNIMVCGGRARLIDFQGMRFGSPWYDVASLAFDPYLNPDENFRSAVFDYYFGESENFFKISRANAETLFFAAACERLSQALGAYCFLADAKGKKEYLQYIFPAANLLASAAQKAGLKGLEELARTVSEKSGGLAL